MRFALTPDQTEFTTAVRELLTDQATEERLRQAAENSAERTGTVWSQLADLGLFAALLPETVGGLGLGGLDAALMAEQLGRFAVPGPVPETALHVPFLLSRCTSSTAEQWSERLGRGGIVASVRMDPGGLIADADLADLVLLSVADTVRAASREQLTLVEQPQIDRTRKMYSTTTEPDTLAVVTDDPHQAQLLRDVGAVLCAAQLIGAGAAVMDRAVDYAAQRTQFGRQIGSYQALKHQLANVRIALDFARPLVLRAGHSLDGDGSARSRDCSAAKAAAADAGLLAAKTALQVHGAIGYTDELALQLWLKRIWALLPQWGTANEHRAAVLGSFGQSPRQLRYP